MKTTVGQITDKGLKRQANEDNLLAMASRGVFIVADGVGGRKGGQTASRTVAEVFEKVFSQPLPSNSDLPLEDLRQLVANTIDLCNQKIYTEAEMNPELSGMATTIAMAAVKGNRAIVAHVGDSRVYRCDARGLIRLTEDHSEVNEAVRQGWMTAEQAESHPRRNVISRAVGADSEVEPEIIEIEVDETTTLFLCSDGITRHIRDEQIERLLRSGNHPQTICDTMKQLCYNEGAEDNLTAIIIDFGERSYVDELTRPMRSMQTSAASNTERPRKRLEINLRESATEVVSVAENNPAVAEQQQLSAVSFHIEEDSPTGAQSENQIMAEEPILPQQVSEQTFSDGAANQSAEQKVEMSKFMRLSVLIVTLLAGFVLGCLFGGPLSRVVNQAGGPLMSADQPRILRYSPRDASVAAAYALMNEGRNEESRAQLNEILLRDQSNAEAHYCLGRLDYNEKKYDEAINHFRQAVQLNQELDESWVFIASAYLQIGQARNASDSLQKLITPPNSTSPPPGVKAEPTPSAKPVG